MQRKRKKIFVQAAILTALLTAGCGQDGSQAKPGEQKPPSDKIQETPSATAEQSAVPTMRSGIKRRVTVLPTFQYAGTDPIMAALCEYMMTSDKWDERDLETGETWIPAFVVFGTVEYGEELLVYCDLWNFKYCLKEDVLMERGGGEMPCLVHMRKKSYDDSYVVAEVEEAGDGHDGNEDFRAFCNRLASSSQSELADMGKEIFNKYRDWEIHGAMRDAIQKELLQQYVRQNDLPVKYYKYEGWDPVSIF